VNIWQSYPNIFSFHQKDKFPLPSYLLFLLANDLPSFGAEDFSVTVSGFGTGATQALTTAIANSATIAGIGLIAGVSYGDNNAIKN
jgi:hypothetical protein